MFKVAINHIVKTQSLKISQSSVSSLASLSQSSSSVLFKYNQQQQSSSSSSSSSTSSIIFVRYYSNSKNKMTTNQLFVTPTWLNDNLDKVKVLDASWYMPHEKRDIRKDFEEAHIPSSHLFNIDEYCDKTVALPHNLPSSAEFEHAAGQLLGISDKDHVVIYDTRGTYVASARVWWTFAHFGHPMSKISILQGGLPAWQREGKKTEAGKIQTTSTPSTYTAKPAQDTPLLKNKQHLIDNLQSKQYQVVDARVADRFYGRVDEPRPGLHRGHIPGSFNVPWVEVVNAKEGGYIPKDDFLKLFKERGVDVNAPILTTCGSGTTAAVLTLGLYHYGYPIAPVYDGSWSEWGQPAQNLPHETEKK
ncbi:hypothetical protein DFA_05697 [Cavenderia fasciculata]|uniref:Sulfurtransferase n=1 Tax=Cavenderia fasciculata TaxID=261658 RepID=F4PM64_CACFS|nr:uncharacterized protein DFA_05697 [Cavenderia fasciculata]EGG23564.1 hypothetical protein DFA_05697 [Cavenderia fasciculata]|eukprot:XP_004361415.1 hypothetical protein DFA_05697 [Cavenderia fasciculata]